MADVPIVNRSMVAAPKNYQLPQGQEILLKAVRAEIDGTAAGGSYLPALQLVSDAGDVMWTAVDTSNAQAAGGTQSVSWFPGLGGQQIALPLPGQILQGYGGAFAAADFSWTGPSFTLLSTGFPSNPNFTKISNTSALWFALNGDFNPAGAPDVLSLCLAIDGALEENIFAHVSTASTIISISWSKIRGLGHTSNAPLAAGAHTFDVKVSSASNAGTKTLLCSTSCDFMVTEFEP